MYKPTHTVYMFLMKLGVSLHTYIDIHHYSVIYSSMYELLTMVYFDCVLRAWARISKQNATRITYQRQIKKENE